MKKGLVSFLGLCLLVQICFAQEDAVKAKKTKIAIYPAFAYSPETAFNIGAIGFFVFNSKKDSSGFYRPSSVTPYVSFTTNSQLLIKSDFDVYFKNGMNLNLEAGYFNFPDFYYGIGSHTDPNIKSKYSDKYVRFTGRVYKPFNEKVYAGLQFDLQYNKIENPDSLLLTDNPAGLNGGRNMGIGPVMVYDTRDNTFYPTHGRFVIAGINVFNKVLGGEYNYTNYLFDYRQYFELLGPKNILVFQFKMNMTSGSTVPFYKLNPLGGGGRLRGINHRNLYRDRNSVYFQVEARQELFWRLGGVIFAGIGEVFEKLSAIEADNVRFIYGLGGRFNALKDEKLNIRIDVGFTDNGQHAFYLSVREAF